ncbi:MAG: sugar phosphate isomerase/epimerase family protein [Fimbriimonas sp.]
MRLSVQLYTLRDPLAQDLAGTLSQVRTIGLEYVELAGLNGRSAQEWRTLLDELGLKVSGAHIGVDALRDDFDKTIEDCKILGIDTVIVPWIGPEAGAEGWDAIGKSLEPIAQRVKDAGLKFAYHNHAHEFEGDGLDKFYAATDPSLILAELDLAWVHIGGQDPAAYVRKMAGRVPVVHLKDYDPAQDPQWRPAGQGVLDWDSVLAACNEVGVEFGALELDVSPGDPIEAVRQSYEFFKAKGLS